MVRWLILWLAMLLMPPATAATGAAPRAPLVLAAASMAEALNDAADAWAAAGHPRPVLSFAASSALARQVAAGAAADLFISADEAWMDDVARRGRIVPGTRAVLAGNALVLVARRGTAPVDVADRRLLARTLSAGPLAMADPAGVPAGRYGVAALQALGVWKALEPRVVRAENVRAALALVERGAAPFGIVYATDARVAAVAVVARFPAASHPPIRYPIARLTASQNREGEGFRRFLLSAAGQAILARHGFVRG